MAVPILTTTALSLIQVITATSGGGTITSALSVTVKGVCWNTTGTPTTSDTKTTNGTGLTAFSSNLTGLVELTTYYVRAYATNSDGTGYGNELSFTTISDSIIKSVMTAFKEGSEIPVFPSLKSVMTAFKEGLEIPVFPSLKSSIISFDRVQYQNINQPLLLSISTSWGRVSNPDYTNNTNNSFFQFGG